MNILKKKETPEEDHWVDNGSFEDSLSEEIQPDNLRYEIEYDEDLLKYEHRLRNERKNHLGKWSKIVSTEPRMNEKGIALTMGSLYSMLNKGTTLSNIKESYAKQMAAIRSRTYKKRLILDYEDFAVQKADIPSLVEDYYHQVYSVLTRPVNDGERKLRAKRFGFKETYAHNEVNAGEIGNKLTL